jgi:hypothetical protein
MARTRRLIGLISLIAFEAASIVMLHRLGTLEWLRIDWGDLGAWIAASTPEDAVAAAIRLAALALAYWLAATTVVYTLARISRISAAIRAVEWATVPAVRKVVDGALAVTMTAAAFAGPVGPAVAQDPIPVVVEVEDQGGPIPEIIAPETPPPTTDPAAPPVLPLGPERIGWSPSSTDARRLEDPPVAPAELPLVTAPGPEPQRYDVQKGDNLWTISVRHLEAVTGRSDLGNSEIARYWRRVIDTNRESLRSGDPDLIYPGERIELPPLDAEESS